MENQHENHPSILGLHARHCFHKKLHCLRSFPLNLSTFNGCSIAVPQIERPLQEPTRLQKSPQPKPPGGRCGNLGLCHRCELLKVGRMITIDNLDLLSVSLGRPKIRFKQEVSETIPK